MTHLNTILAFLLLVVLSGCGNDEAAEPAAGTRADDGVQVAEIEAGTLGYEPATVTLEAGVPARLVFTRTADSECMEQVQIPEFGVAPTELPLGEPVAVEFTPEEGGEFTFVCGMNMQRGTIVVKS